MEHPPSAVAPRLRDAVAAIILTYGESNQHSALTLTMASMLEPGRVVIVYNSRGPADTFSPFVPAQSTLLRTKRNLGYAGGMNLGIAHARTRLRSEFYLLLTHDTYLGPPDIALMMDIMRADPTVAVVGPRLVHRDTGMLLSAGGSFDRWCLPTPIGASGHGRAEPLWVDGAVMLIRGEALDAVGRLDERFFMYAEECDLCWRMRRAGWRIRVASTAQAAAAPGGSHRSRVYQYLMARNRLELAYRMAGTRGAILSCVQVCKEMFRILPTPLGRRYWHTPDRRAALGQGAATASGILHFVLRRFGPPPPRLTTGTDVRGT